MITIIVNGNSRRVPSGATVHSLIQQLNLTPRAIAVELNRNLLPRSEFSHQRLSDGDQVEIVTLVGGG